ncbi:MAG: ATP-dependent helicase, partial [Chloroflexota bacterium]
GPGAGKTTVLGERAAWLIAGDLARPEAVLVLAPSRRAAEAVARYARRRLGGLPGPSATSFHGLALTLLRRHYAVLGYRRPPVPLDFRSLPQTLRDLLAAEDPVAWGPYGPMLGSSALRTLATDAVRGAAENGLDEAALRALGEGPGAGTPLRELAGFYGRYREHLRREGLVDFSALLAQAVDLLDAHPTIARQCQEEYRCILVDEFEEASYVKAELLCRLVGPQTDLVVAGDPEEGIGSYQGGCPEYLRQCAERLGARVFTSVENHRAAPRPHDFCRAIRPATAGDTPKPPAVSEAPGPSEEQGSVVLRPFAYGTDEAAWVAAEVASLVRAGTPPAEIAVVFRSLRSPLARLVQTELARRNIPCAVPANGGVLREPLLQATVDLLRYLAGEEPPDEGLPRLLDSPLGGLPPFGLDELRRAAASAGASVAGLLIDGIDGANLDVGEDVRAAIVSLRERLAGLEERTEWSMASLLWEIWRLFPAFAADARAEGKAARAYAALLAEVARLEEGGSSLSPSDLVERLERGDFDGLGATERRQTGVAITTVHQAKGREWAAVFLPDLCEEVFPLRRSPLDLVAPLLMRDLPVAGDEFDTAALVAARHNAEERRIFYVAASRACRALYLSYSRYGADGTTTRLPSRFLDTVSSCPDVEVVPGQWRENLPLHPTGAVAHYRARLRAADPLERARAVYALHRLRGTFPEAMRPAGWWENVPETAGGAPPFPGGRLYLSASRLGAYRECPLAYERSYHWRLYERTGTAATLGSILHGVLEEYHRPGSLLPRGRESLQQLLEERFDESAFPYRPVARQAKRNLEKLLDLYYERYGLDGPALAVERRFAFDFGPHVVTGFIDRVDEVAPGELEIIDYKSGGAMKYEDAEADLQLALYDLAFLEDPDLQALGRPVKVSYLYPKNIGKRADGKRSYEPSETSREYLQQRVRYYADGILGERFPSHHELAMAFADLDAAELERLLKKDPCRFCGWTWLCPWSEKGAAGD